MYNDGNQGNINLEQGFKPTEELVTKFRIPLMLKGNLSLSFIITFYFIFLLNVHKIHKYQINKKNIELI